MQVCSVQGNSFQGIYTPSNFNPTPVQEKIIKTIKSNLTKDTSIYRKGKNFHDFLESKGTHFILENGDYKDEIKVGIGCINSNDNFIKEQNCGSFPENRLDSVVEQAKAAWRENRLTNVTWIVFALGFIGFILAGFLAKK